MYTRVTDREWPALLEVSLEIYNGKCEAIIAPRLIRMGQFSWVVILASLGYKARKITDARKRRRNSKVTDTCGHLCHVEVCSFARLKKAS